MHKVGNSMLRWLWLSVLVLFLDQTTKYFAICYLEVYKSAYILPFFNLTLAFNTGAAFSFLSDSGHAANYFFIGFAAVVSIAIIWMLSRMEQTLKLQAFCYAMILGGAVGNLFDRVRLGFVVDFLDFHVAGYHWPAFNIADSAICIGVVLLIVDVFRSK